MKVTIHTLFWDNTDPRVIEYSKKVMNHLDLPVNYTLENIHHGVWIDRVLQNTNSDITLFLDSDCVPLNRQAIDDVINYCSRGYLVGNAQVTNCIRAKHDLFCAPSMFAITKQMYEQLGKPSAVNNRRSDVAQEITRAAVEQEKRIKMYFPDSFQGVPTGGIWRLSGYGYYGIGTVFDQKFYHLFQARFSQNVDKFVETCSLILKDKASEINKQYPSKGEYAGVLPIEDDYGY